MEENRLSKFQQELKTNRMDGFIVTNPINIFYLLGFRGISQTERESYLIFNPAPTLIAPRLYQQEALKLRSKNLNVKIARERTELLENIETLLKKCKKVGFEKENLTYGEFQKLSKNLKLIPTENLVENMRVIKTEDEIKKIEKAQIISQKAFDQILKTLKVGQTEEEIANTLQSIIKSLGGHGLAFETIIASGPNSGYPHHQSGKRKIQKGDVLLFDFGAKFQNYHADLSRTIFVGKAKDEQKNIFHHVKTAQQKAITQIKAGTKTKKAFDFSNSHFQNLKLEEYFLHGLGHGIGLEIHEPPYLRSSTEDELLENMVFSVEPGLYFPWGGVRIEDLVVIQNGKAKVLGKLQEDIMEI